MGYADGTGTFKFSRGTGYQPWSCPKIREAAAVDDMAELMEEPETVVVGLCDVDQHHLAEPEHIVKRKFGENHEAKTTAGAARSKLQVGRSFKR